MVSHEKPEGILLTIFSFRKPQTKLQDMLLEGLKTHTHTRFKPYHSRAAHFPLRIIPIPRYYPLDD